MRRPDWGLCGTCFFASADRQVQVGFGIEASQREKNPRQAPALDKKEICTPKSRGNLGATELI